MLILPEVCVQYSLLLLSVVNLMSCFPGMLFKNFQDVTETVPIAPIIIGVTFVFAFHVGCISFVRHVHFKILLPSFLITFLLTDTLHVSFHCHGLGCPVYCSGWSCLNLLLLLL